MIVLVLGMICILWVQKASSAPKWTPLAPVRPLVDDLDFSTDFGLKVTSDLDDGYGNCSLYDDPGPQNDYNSWDSYFDGKISFFNNNNSSNGIFSDYSFGGERKFSSFGSCEIENTNSFSLWMNNLRPPNDYNGSKLGLGNLPFFNNSQNGNYVEYEFDKKYGFPSFGSFEIENAHSCPLWMKTANRAIALFGLACFLWILYKHWKKQRKNSPQPLWNLAPNRNPAKKRKREVEETTSDETEDDDVKTSRDTETLRKDPKSSRKCSNDSQVQASASSKPPSDRILCPLEHSELIPAMVEAGPPGDLELEWSPVELSEVFSVAASDHPCCPLMEPLEQAPVQLGTENDPLEDFRINRSQMNWFEEDPRQSPISEATSVHDLILSPYKKPMDLENIPQMVKTGAPHPVHSEFTCPPIECPSESEYLIDPQFREFIESLDWDTTPQPITKIIVDETGDHFHISAATPPSSELSKVSAGTTPSEFEYENLPGMNGTPKPINHPEPASLPGMKNPEDSDNSPDENGPCSTVPDEVTDVKDIFPCPRFDLEPWPTEEVTPNAEDQEAGRSTPVDLVKPPAPQIVVTDVRDNLKLEPRWYVVPVEKRERKPFDVEPTLKSDLTEFVDKYKDWTPKWSGAKNAEGSKKVPGFPRPVKKKVSFSEDVEVKRIYLSRRKFPFVPMVFRKRDKVRVIESIYPLKGDADGTPFQDLKLTELRAHLLLF